MVAVGVSASSKHVCSGLVRGGAGAFRLFDRRFRNKIGPRLGPPPLMLPQLLDNDVTGGFDVLGDGDVTRIAVGGCGIDDDVVGVETIGPISSAGVLKPDESCDNFFNNSLSKSSSRPIRCDISCISCCESAFKSNTVAIRSRCANVLDCSRNPLSNVSALKLIRATVSRSE